MLVRRTFSLDTERDASLLTWLDAQDNASEAIRAALRGYCDSTGIGLRDVYSAVKTLEAQICGGHLVRVSRTSEETPEDPDLALQLDQLGL